MFDRVAVTGGTGFIGSHLVRALVALGCHPILLARSARVGAPPEDLPRQVRWVPVELTDGEAVREALLRERPTTLFHLAGTRGCKQAPGTSVACAIQNVCSTVQLLDAAHRAGVRRIVSIGSAEAFGNQPGPMHEGLAMQPLSPYGASMAAATLFALAMHSTEGCPVVVVRAFSVYGPGQPRDMFVASAVAAAVDGLPFRMSQGLQRRDLVYVDDLVRALIRAADAPGIDGRVIHVGSGSAHALRDVADLIWRLSGTTAPLLVGALQASAGGLSDTWADITLARELLGWKPEIDLETGLRRTIEWARERTQMREQACLLEP